MFFAFKDFLCTAHTSVHLAFLPGAGTARSEWTRCSRELSAVQEHRYTTSLGWWAPGSLPVFGNLFQSFSVRAESQPDWELLAKIPR